jgi:fatty acid desaturase
MPAVAAVRPTDIFSAQEWRALTHVSRWRGLALIAHGWASVALIIAATLWVGYWLAFIPAIFLLGGRQLGLAILMHDAAHGCAHPNRRLNNFAGEWLTGAAVGSDLKSYRTYHLTHHRYTQQPEDPDLGLSKPFPTSSASLWRKVLRDMTGQTFFKQRAAQFAIALVGLKAMLRGEGTDVAVSKDATAGTPFNRQGANRPGAAGINGPAEASTAGSIAVTKTVARFLLVQALLLTLSLILWGWTPYLLWLAALATTFQLALRIRNIAEHACTTTGSSDPFSHARTTMASWTERALVAPYYVNYHAEHHLFMGVPCYNLPRVHQLLMDRGHGERMTLADGYAQVMRRVVTAD